MCAITILLFGLGLDGSIGFIDGVIFWLLFIGFLLYLLNMAKKNPTEEDVDDISMGKALILTIIGLALIVFGSDIAVDGATSLARILGLSERFIGLTIVALGTSLPELVASVTAARKGNADIAIGNIVGSNIFNILFAGAVAVTGIHGRLKDLALVLHIPEGIQRNIVVPLPALQAYGGIGGIAGQLCKGAGFFHNHSLLS